jgi:hypothetical protein
MKYLLTAILTVVLSAAAWADDVCLADGRALVGIAREESARWVVRTRLGDFGIPKGDVLSVVPGRTLLHDYDERLAELYGCPAAREVFDLALWAQRQGLVRYVNRLRTWTLELDPDHAEARRLLGYVRYDGRWILSSERDALLLSLNLYCKRVPESRAKTHQRPRRSLETTPYTLGIPMTQ